MGLGAGPREGEKALHALAIGFETLSNLTLSLLARDDLHAVAQLTSACEKYYIQLLANMWLGMKCYFLHREKVCVMGTYTSTLIMMMLQKPRP